LKTTELHKPPAGAASADPVRYAIPLVDVTEQEYQEPLAVLVYGEAGSGKSRMLATAPDPIGVVPMERKARQTVLRTASELGKRIIMPEIDLVRPARAALTAVMPDSCITPDNPKFRNYKQEDQVKAAEQEMQRRTEQIPLDGEAPGCCQRCYYRFHANRTKSILFRMADRPDIRTIAIDTFGQFVDDLLFANYGRNERIMPLDRKTFNREVCDVLNTLSHKNLVLVHQSANIWRDNKPTNKTKPASSFAKIGHYVNVVVQLDRNDLAPMGAGRYVLRVDDCQANAALIGMDLLYDDDISFARLATLVYPDSDESDWA